MLIANHKHEPILLQQALDLSKTVAEEDNHVYEEFFGRGNNPGRLVTYLENLREASILSLQSGGSPFQLS